GLADQAEAAREREIAQIAEARECLGPAVVGEDLARPAPGVDRAALLARVRPEPDARVDADARLRDPEREPDRLDPARIGGGRPVEVVVGRRDDELRIQSLDRDHAFDRDHGEASLCGRRSTKGAKRSPSARTRAW